MIYRGTYFERIIEMRDEDGAVINIDGWEFEASVKGEDGTEVIDASSATGEFSIESAADGELKFSLTAVQTGALTTDLIKFDVVRTDISPGPVQMFALEIDVRDLGE